MIQSVHPMYILAESCAQILQGSRTKVFTVALFVIVKNIPGSHPCLTAKKDYGICRCIRILCNHGNV